MTLFAGPSGDIALRLLASPLAFLEEITRQHGSVAWSGEVHLAHL